MSGFGAVPFDREGRAGIGRADGELLAGRYRVEDPTRPISAGVDTWSDEPVLVKRSEHTDREAEVLEAVRHPGVVRLRERLADDLLVLDFVDGIDLGTLLASRGRLEGSRLEALLSSLAEALEAVHAAGFLHRDLKPANILLRPDGSPVVVDFGAAARVAEGMQPPDPSLLTAGYAAPEQYLTDWPEGSWTDVYGLGAIAYHAVSGQPPPPAVERLKRDRMAPAIEVGAGNPDPLLRAIDRALVLEPSGRLRTVADWLSVLRASADGGQPAASAEPAPGSDHDYPPTVPVRRVPIGQVRRPAEAPSLAAPSASLSRRRGVLWLVCLLGLVGLGVLVALYGRPLYERYLKDEWLVDQAGEGDVASIAEAIARARDGATIRIAPGTYAESVRLDRPLHLRPAAQDSPPLIAPGEGSCVELTGTGASIAGVTLMAPAPADPSGAPVPCIVARGRGGVIEGNRVGSASGAAILVRDGADPMVRGNTIEDAAGPGILITAGATGEVTGNTITGITGSSVIISGGAAPVIADNVIERSGSVVYAEGARGRFERNRIEASRASAIQVTSGALPMVADNTIEQPTESGIFVFDQGGGRFTGNTITGSALSGVMIADGAGVELSGNTVRESAEHGILVVGTSTVVLEANTVADNKGHGIAIAPEASAELRDNALSGNQDPQLLDAREP